MNWFQRRRCTCAALVVLAIGCSKGDATPKDSASAPRVTSATPRVMPGALTKPIDSYTGDEFHDLVTKLQFTGGAERERKCKNDPACNATKSPKRTKVFVDAVVTQDSIAPATVPEFGVVYVRAVNKGDAEEARYGLKPGPNLEYYSIILRDSAGGMKWRLEMFDTKARQHASAGTGQFHPCNHAWVAGAKADFKDCATAASAHDSVKTLGLSLQGGLDAPLWAACAMGCCVENP